MVQVMETNLSNTGAEGQPLLCNGTAKGHSWAAKDTTDSPLHESYRGKRRDKNGDLAGGDTIISIPLPPPERIEPRLVQEKWKTLTAFGFLSGNLVLNLTCLAVVHERVPDRSKYPPLPDIFFDLFPPLDWALDVSEIIIIISIWSTLLLLFIHRYRWIVLQRVFFIMGILYLMRSITMFVTQVPVASTTYYCSPKANTTNPLLIMKRVIQLLSGFGLSINGQHTFCGDYIYSGHTVILTLSYLVVREYSPQRWKLLHIFYLLLSSVGIIMVLLSRGHYTVDVVLGYYVTSRVFLIYHSLANNNSLKIPSQNNNFLARVWWFPLFTYFEKNVGGVVPRQYEWPLPWPRRWLPRTRIS
ncbi:phosphatidylcholine:ceramide cholinephosphotransferase 2-like [Ornithodoros turicata]|uniref:phosphatidylcholine:ceramide cholinephosphotransferase 2-like n=1 Tax=Ornithodoros turicata TaxID=34597 RepID=UPI003139C841